MHFKFVRLFGVNVLCMIFLKCNKSHLSAWRQHAIICMNATWSHIGTDVCEISLKIQSFSIEISIQKCRLQNVSHFGQTSGWYNRRIESMKPLRSSRKLALLEATLITLKYTCADCLACGIKMHIKESLRKIQLAPRSTTAPCIVLNSSFHSLRRWRHRKWHSKVFSKLSFFNYKRMSVYNHRKMPDYYGW